ncbi:unnamed protein product, partial [Durusdinium trenchii]
QARGDSGGCVVRCKGKEQNRSLNCGEADFAHKKFFVQKSTETGKTGKPDLFCSGDYDARVSRRRLRELLVVRLIL